MICAREATILAKVGLQYWFRNKPIAQSNPAFKFNWKLWMILGWGLTYDAGAGKLPSAPSTKLIEAIQTPDGATLWVSLANFILVRSSLC